MRNGSEYRDTITDCLCLVTDIIFSKCSGLCIDNLTQPLDTRHPWLGSRSRQHRVAELLVMCRTLRKSNILHTSLAIGYSISIFLSPRCNFLSRIQLNMPLAYSLDARNCFQVYLHCFHIFIYCIIAYSFLSMFCLIVALSHLLPTLMTHTKIHLHSCFLP